MKYMYINDNDVRDQYIEYFGPIPSSIEVTTIGARRSFGLILGPLLKLVGLSGKVTSPVRTTREVSDSSVEYLATRVLQRARRDRRVIRKKLWTSISRQVFQARKAAESPLIQVSANLRVEGSEDRQAWKDKFETNHFITYRLDDKDPLKEELARHNVGDLTMGSSGQHKRGELIGNHGYLLPAFQLGGSVKLSVFGWLLPARSDEHGYRPYIKPIVIWL